MKDSSFESEKFEEDRIQAAYARRKWNGFYSWFNMGYVFLMQQQERKMLIALERYGFSPLSNRKILEIGCGRGYWLCEFIKWGANPKHIFGVDLLPDRVENARRLCPERVHIECGNATRLNFPDESFDLVLQSTVFSSVLDPSVRKQIASEMLRVVKGNGALFWYDFHKNNPKNPDVQGMKKDEIFRLFPECQINLQRITLAPPLVRLLAPYSPISCYLLEKLKVLNTHYLGVICKNQNLR
ncbi:MAG: class I SAM-dependent methyltransferase [Nitrospirales bacterium]|nr:class I SAM-dependent methyltransferase [Nitrospirales bacterium]